MPQPELRVKDVAVVAAAVLSKEKKNHNIDKIIVPNESEKIKATEEPAVIKPSEIQQGDEKKNGPSSDSEQSNGKQLVASDPTKKKKRRNCYYYFAYWYRALGLRHWFMVFLMLSCSLLGGLMFHLSETPAEMENMEETVKRMEDRLTELATKAVSEVENGNITSQSDMEMVIQNMYVAMQKTEDLYKLSAFYKNETPDNLQWHYWPAVFYSSNIYMTVGYGAIQCFTNLGRVYTVLFGFISIPFSFVVIRDLGQWILVSATKIYARALIKYRKARGIETEPDEDMALPIKIALLMLVGQWLFCSFCTWFYDSFMYPEGSGISFFGATYYTYITLTSIGMSDEMPRNTTTSAMLTVWMFLGLPIYKMGFRVGYIAIENGILGSIAVFENKLEKWESEDDTDAVVPRKRSFASRAAVDQDEQDQIEEQVNNFTVRSIATFMKSQADAYGGEFGRPHIVKSQLDD